MVKFCPHRDFCFDTGHIILLVVATIGIWCYYRSTKGIEVNALDKISEGNIIKNLKLKFPNMTLVYVSHRPIKSFFNKTFFKKELSDLQNEIYPELEKIFLHVLNSSGHPELKFGKKVDFDELYKKNQN